MSVLCLSSDLFQVNNNYRGNEIIISVWPSEIVTPKYHIACSVKLSWQKPIITSIQQKTTDSRNVKYVKCRNYYRSTQINFLHERNVTKILITSYFLKKCQVSNSLEMLRNSILQRWKMSFKVTLITFVITLAQN